MFDIFHNFSPMVKGNLLMFAGIILLLHTLGVTMKAIYILMLASSIFMILYGFVQAGYYTKVMELIFHKQDIGPTK